MDRFIPYVCLLLALLLVALAWAIALILTQLREKRAELLAFENEEARMFDYLHNLGLAIGTEMTSLSLYRTIVDGVVKVVMARGGALYLLDQSGKWMQPKYLSEQCPPLVGIAPELRERAKQDQRALESYLRLTQLPAAEGVFGAAFSADDAVHIEDLKALHASRDRDSEMGSISVLVSPLKHGGRNLGVLAVARNLEDGGFSPNDFSVFRSAAEQSAFALGNALLYREANEKRQIESELRNASEVQRVLLPQQQPVVPGYRIAGTNLPARLISGDYYDYLNLGKGLHGLVIADVSGKGVAAGLMMAMCRSVLRSKAGNRSDPSEVLDLVNRQLFPDMREDMFISLYYGVIDEQTGTIQLARAGHDAALLYRAADRSVEELKPPGLALGIDEGDVFARVTKTIEIRLESGDCLLFHTDGVAEAINESGDEFTMARLREVFSRCAEMGAEAVVDAVQSEVRKFSGDSPQMDDITLLAMEKR